MALATLVWHLALPTLVRHMAVLTLVWHLALPTLVWHLSLPTLLRHLALATLVRHLALATLVRHLALPPVEPHTATAWASHCHLLSLTLPPLERDASYWAVLKHRNDGNYLSILRRSPRVWIRNEYPLEELLYLCVTLFSKSCFNSHHDLASSKIIKHVQYFNTANFM